MQKNKTFGELVRGGMEKQKIKMISVLAKKLDLSREYLSLLINNKTHSIPKGETIRKVAETLGLDFEELRAAALKLRSNSPHKPTYIHALTLNETKELNDIIYRAQKNGISINEIFASAAKIIDTKRKWVKNTKPVRIGFKEAP